MKAGEILGSFLGSIAIGGGAALIKNKINPSDPVAAAKKKMDAAKAYMDAHPGDVAAVAAYTQAMAEYTKAVAENTTQVGHTHDKMQSAITYILTSAEWSNWRALNISNTLDEAKAKVYALAGSYWGFPGDKWQNYQYDAVILKMTAYHEEVQAWITDILTDPINQTWRNKWCNDHYPNAPYEQLRAEVYALAIASVKNQHPNLQPSGSELAADYDYSSGTGSNFSTYFHHTGDTIVDGGGAHKISQADEHKNMQLALHSFLMGAANVPSDMLDEDGDIIPIYYAPLFYTFLAIWKASHEAPYKDNENPMSYNYDV